MRTKKNLSIGALHSRPLETRVQRVWSNEIEDSYW